MIFLVWFSLENSFSITAHLIHWFYGLDICFGGGHFTDFCLFWNLNGNSFSDFRLLLLFISIIASGHHLWRMQRISVFKFKFILIQRIFLVITISIFTRLPLDFRKVIRKSPLLNRLHFEIERNKAGQNIKNKPETPEKSERIEIQALCHCIDLLVKNLMKAIEYDIDQSNS